MKKLLATLGILFGLAAPANAQLGAVPNVFTSGTTIKSADVNTNFSVAYANSLNRTGGTMTGTLTTLNVVPTAGSTYNLGSVGAHFANIYVDALTLTSISCTGCITGANLANTAVSPSSYGSSTAIATFTVDAQGRLTAAASVTPQLTLSSTYFSSLSGINLTSIPETAITNGSLLARVADNETISGNWIFSGTNETIKLSSTTPGVYFNETDAGADLKNWFAVVDSATLQIQTRTDADAVIITPLQIDRSGNVTLNGTIKERARSIALGATQTVSYSAGNFFPDTGTWTVQAGDVVGNVYRVVGDTLWWNLNLITTTVSGSPTQMNVTIPGGFTAEETTYFPCLIYDNGILITSLCKVTTGSTSISVQRFDQGTLSNSTDNTRVHFAVNFKVQ